MPGVGTVLGGDFRIERQLGAGGMGAVYVAEQLSTGRKRALKLMHPSLVSDTKLRERFEQEARVGAKIPSDHVVQVIAAGVDEACGAPFIAMELLEGEDLAATISRGALSPEDTRTILEPVCHALAAAHAAGIVHRDLKPENIFTLHARGSSRSFDVKLLDFGIAKLTVEARTMATSAVGTPLWMAPEQTDPRSKIMPSADVWSLGLVAFTALTGRSYWRAAAEPGVSVQALLREILFEPLVPASVRAVELGVEVPLPAELDRWFARCVDRDPGARFPTAKEAWEALVPAIGSEVAKPTELAALAALGSGGGEGLGLAATAVAGLGGAEMAATMPAPASPGKLAAAGHTTGVAVGHTVPTAEATARRWSPRIPLGLAGAALIAGLTWQVATKRAEDRQVSAGDRSTEQTERKEPILPPVSSASAMPTPEPQRAPEVTTPPSAEPVKPVPAPKSAPAKAPPPSPVPKPFDAVAAQRSVDFLARGAKPLCGRMPGPRGFGVTIVFGADGRVASHRVDPMLRGQPTVTCAVNMLMGASVPPYDPTAGAGFATASILLD